MLNLYLIPNWFFGIDVVFELAFAVVSLIVSLYAFKIYKLSNQTQSKLFGFSFLFFSISYFIQSFMNFAIISKLNENVCVALKFQSIDALNTLGIYAHILFFTLGLATLTYMTLRTNNKKLHSLIIVIAIFFILFSANKIYSFYFLSSIFLIYIVSHYFLNYLENKQTKTLLVLIAFIFLLFGNIHFMFAVNHILFYILAHFLELISYSLILINLLLILKNGKKTK